MFLAKFKRFFTFSNMFSSNGNRKTRKTAIAQQKCCNIATLLQTVENFVGQALFFDRNTSCSANVALQKCNNFIAAHVLLREKGGICPAACRFMAELLSAF